MESQQRTGYPESVDSNQIGDQLQSFSTSTKTQTDLEIIEDYKSVKQILRISFIFLEFETKIK